MYRKFNLFILLVMLFSLLFPTTGLAKTHIEEEIMYKILVDRYNVGEKEKKNIQVDDTYTYHGGDLKGIKDNLGIIEGLGFTAITISPIFKNAPNGYHGYWVEDFFEVNEQFGTMDDFRSLIEEGKERNIKVVLELVTNYVAKSHPFVQDESKSHWFKPVEVETTDSTYYLEDVVVLDQEVPEVREYLLTVVDYWMNETDIAGFNLHAIEQMSPHFLTELIDFVNEKDSSFYLFGTIMDKGNTYEHLEEFKDDILISNDELFEVLQNSFSEVGNPVSPIYETWEKAGGKTSYIYVDDEYSKRFSTLVHNNGRNPSTVWKLALTYMYITPGVPVVLQGTEVMMAGEGFPDTQKLVPYHGGDQDLDQFMFRLASLKKEFPALTKGSFEMVGTDGAMSVFKRTYEGETIFIAINNDEQLRKVDVSGVEEGKRLRGIVGDNLVVRNDDGTYTLGIPRETVEVYLIEEDTGLNWGFIAFPAIVFLIFIIAVIYLSYKQKARSRM